jgi:hypothetical protein
MDQDEADVGVQRRQRTAYGVLPGRSAADDGHPRADVREGGLDLFSLSFGSGYDDLRDGVLERPDGVAQK